MLLVLVMFSASMAISLFLHAYYRVPYTNEIGFACVVASLGVSMIIVFKLRKMFKGDLTGFGGSMEKHGVIGDKPVGMICHQMTRNF